MPEDGSRITDWLIGGVIGAIIGIFLGFLLGPPIDGLFVNIGLINPPKLNVEVHEFKLTADNGVLEDEKKREDLDNLFWKDNYLFYVIDIRNQETPVKFVNNILTRITVNGTIFKINFNSFYEEKCKIERPTKVKFNADNYYREKSPFDEITIKEPLSIEGCRSLIVSCNELAPGEGISLHVYADSNGICNDRCGWDNLGFFSKYWWQSYNNVNKESSSGRITK